MHMKKRFGITDAEQDTGYMRDIFGNASDDRSIANFMRKPNIEITIYVYGEAEFDGSSCPKWERMAIYYSIIDVKILHDLYRRESALLFDMWKQDFVETHVYRCGDIYKFAGTAFHSHTHVPWVGDYG
jgi:hypothetical protein